MFKGFFYHRLDKLIRNSEAINLELKKTPNSYQWLTGKCSHDEKITLAYFKEVLFYDTLEIQFSRINKYSAWFVRSVNTQAPNANHTCFLCFQQAMGFDSNSLIYRLWNSDVNDIPIEWLMEISGFDPNQEQWVFHLDFSYIPQIEAWHYYPSENDFSLERLYFSNRVFQIPWKKRSRIYWAILHLCKPITWIGDILTFPLQILYPRL